MFEKVDRPKRVGNKLIFKFNSTDEMLTFQEIVGLGMYIYASRNRPEFKILLNSINDVDLKRVFKELSES
jgi:hypothetical protein